MTISKEKLDEMLEIAKPLIKWMNENCHPHCVAHVDQVSVILLEEIAGNKTTEFIKD